MGKKWRQFAFQQRSILQAELDWNIVKPAWAKAPIEMPQPRNDYSNHRDLDVGSRLIKDQEIEAGAPGEIDAGEYLIARVVESADLRVGARQDDWTAAWRQKRILLKTQRRDAVEARLLTGFAAHQADRQELVQFGQGAQQCNAFVEMRAGAELDIFMPVLHPVQDRHIGRNAEIAGDVEHPQFASRIGELGVQIANVGIVELAEIDRGPLRSIVPPDGVRVPFHEFEETLDDRLFAGVAGSAAVGIGLKAGPAIEEI